MCLTDKGHSVLFHKLNKWFKICCIQGVASPASLFVFLLVFYWLALALFIVSNVCYKALEHLRLLHSTFTEGSLIPSLRRAISSHPSCSIPSRPIPSRPICPIWERGLSGTRMSYARLAVRLVPVVRPGPRHRVWEMGCTVAEVMGAHLTWRRSIGSLFRLDPGSNTYTCSDGESSHRFASHRSQSTSRRCSATCVSRGVKTPSGRRVRSPNCRRRALDSSTYAFASSRVWTRFATSERSSFSNRSPAICRCACSPHHSLTSSSYTYSCSLVLLVAARVPLVHILYTSTVFTLTVPYNVHVCARAQFISIESKSIESNVT